MYIEIRLIILFLIVNTDYNGKDDYSVISAHGVLSCYDIRPE